MCRLVALLAAFTMACDATGQANGDVVAQTPSALARAIGQTGDLAKAEAAINAGRPWRATQIVAPVLRDPKRKTPAALLVAARAAAGWGGWAEVDKLLGAAPWVDTAFDAEGRELLVRAALERDLDTIAMRHASALMKDSATGETKAVRSVLFARALERNNYFDGAATAYASAADQLRSVRDWLLLRSAGNESDSAKRSAAYARVTLTPSRARVPWTEAQARERFRDALGAASRFAKLGAVAQSFRLRLSVAPDSGTRDSIKAEALAYIREHPGTAESKSAVEVLDRAFTSHTAQEQLVMARSASINGPPARAVSGFDRASAAGIELTPDDRFRYGQALARVNRSRDAIKQLSLVEGALAGQAAYQRARITLSSDGGAAAARASLRDVWARFPTDTAASSAAMSLYADLVTDEGKDAEARATYLQLSRTYPTSARAPEARLQAGLISLVAGQGEQAARELDSLVARYPRSEVAGAARYWSGRAWKAAGDDQAAGERWRALLGQQPISYYTVMSAQRLGEAVPSPAQGGGTGGRTPRVAAVDSAIARIKLLERLGMDFEARFEMDALEERANTSTERALATAAAFLAIDQSSRAIHVAQKLAEAGQRDGRVMRILYPVVDRDELTRAAKAQGLEPALVAAIIRQESSFNPRAVSVADARGLMQVLPSVGQEVARSLGFPVWYPALLLDADANLQLGTAHLAAYRKQYGPLPRVLAAYNAGGSRVERWSGRPGADDPEMFTERIPFAETREYVRVVGRNLAVYRQLYDWR
ncbi:MAG TPA: transglycosylase SLT domain-containing protein [Gemmatimonadaceae bacterium]|nr:transglycosylase SLT domain-containing protein [Gemmatimonadaceae bacterium]